MSKSSWSSMLRRPRPRLVGWFSCPRMSRVRVDLAMAGTEIDLTALPLPRHGIDLTVRMGRADLSVRVPADWRVSWRFRGGGGIEVGSRGLSASPPPG